MGANDSEARSLRPPTSGSRALADWAIFDERADISALWRPLNGGWLVTLSLSNRQESRNSGDPKQTAKDTQHANEHALFEARLDCFVHKGTVGPYPGVDFELLTQEEQELELRYRDRLIYAVGHGAAADWTLHDNRVARLRTEFLPRTEVPRVSADPGGEGEVLDVDYHATPPSDSGAYEDLLARFVSDYEAWIEVRSAQGKDLPPHEQAPAARILKRMGAAATRMRAGCALLARDPVAARAFALANQAMAMQMRQGAMATGRPPRRPRWRPFQLAFLLLTLESAVDEDSLDRDTLDLIWFPTGGGKTEAYLGLMAFVIVWRRLRFPATGGGTTVLMRYTLRLLTKDQFRRAARLICALEILRRGRSDLGDTPISLGLWVGGASSPNRFLEAKEALDKAVEARQQRPPSLLVLENCPWCGADFTIPGSFDAGPEHFHFRCTNPECKFGAQGGGQLPCNVVDEALYERPPTLLLATIDKFARLAWEERSTTFFCANDNRPPELIIQDELHLIAGALGSVAGLYEAALETVLIRRGVRPKYIASIRMAAEQVQRLYGREAAVFPPPGLDADDAYFARTAPTSEESGRLYVGYLAPARNRQRCLAPLAAALLAAPEALFGDAPSADQDALLDAWWTVLVYHGSLKGVGISRNALQDIEQSMARFEREERDHLEKEGASDGRRGNKVLGWTRRKRLAEHIAQLTSHMTADENARSFERLALGRDDADSLDLALATNMVSVGLDVSRLAAMIVNGQPLTTAEYIQASSRENRCATWTCCAPPWSSTAS